MTKKINSEFSGSCTCENDEMLLPSLKRFVQMVKSNVINQTMNDIHPGDMIQNAEKLEKKLLDQCSDTLDSNSPRESGDLRLDAILHHRVLLSTGIAKSFAAGNGLSQQRRKILKSNIDYIENSF